jgi:Phytanoyl-CoA dioxygenase (PhyH)
MSTATALIPLEREASAAYPINLPWVESPFFPALLAERKLPPHLADMARQYHRDGFCSIENLAGPEQCARIIDQVEPLFRPGVTDGARSYYRVQDAWQESPAVAELAAHPRVLELLEFLYQRQPIPFQTLNFRHGSQQPAHSDSIHFSCLPERYMCGVWVALEDVTEENGPLFYYPGSHKLPERDLYDLGMTLETLSYSEYERATAALMKAHGFRPERLLVNKGSALVWSSNLVHGGTAIAKAGTTRSSQVSHYYFDECIYYTPFYSNRKTGQYFHRRDTIDIRTRKPVLQSYNGRPFRAFQLGNGRSILQLEGEGPPTEAAGGGAGVTVLSLEAELARVRSEIEGLRTYRSYRLGRAMSAPYRFLRGAMRGGRST